MEINNAQGSAAYKNSPVPVPPVENTVAPEQHSGPLKTPPDTQAAQTAQQAFEVTITEEARDLFAKETQDPEPASTAPQSMPETVENRPEKNIPPDQGTTNTPVNIVV